MPRLAAAGVASAAGMTSAGMAARMEGLAGQGAGGVGGGGAACPGSLPPLQASASHSQRLRFHPSPRGHWLRCAAKKPHRTAHDAAQAASGRAQLLIGRGEEQREGVRLRCRHLRLLMSVKTMALERHRGCKAARSYRSIEVRGNLPQPGLASLRKPLPRSPLAAPQAGAGTSEASGIPAAAARRTWGLPPPPLHRRRRSTAAAAPPPLPPPPPPAPAGPRCPPLCTAR